MSESDLYITPRPIGGWLILIALGLFVAPVQLMYFTLQTYLPIFRDGSFAELTDPAAPYYHPLWGPLLVGEIVVNIALVALFIWMIMLFLRKNWRFPHVFIFVRILVIVILLVDAYALSIVLPDLPMFDPQTVRDLMQNVVGAAIWVPYMLISKRVKETFIVGAPRGSDTDIARRFE